MKMGYGRVFYDFSKGKLLLRETRFHAVHLIVMNENMESELF
jgi:hypothetical protein